MVGYGVLEMVGDGYILPVIRNRADFQHETPFWALPGQPGAGGGLPAPMSLPSQPRVAPSVPVVQYTSERERARRTTPAKVAKTAKTAKAAKAVKAAKAAKVAKQPVNPTKRGGRAAPEPPSDRESSRIKRSPWPGFAQSMTAKLARLP